MSCVCPLRRGWFGVWNVWMKITRNSARSCMMLYMDRLWTVDEIMKSPWLPKGSERETLCPVPCQVASLERDASRTQPEQQGQLRTTDVAKSVFMCFILKSMFGVVCSCCFSWKFSCTTTTYQLSSKSTADLVSHPHLHPRSPKTNWM